MTLISCRQVDLLRANTSRTWANLHLYMERKRVSRMPFIETQEVAVAAAQFVLIDSTTHLPGQLLAVMAATPPTCTTNAGVMAAVLAGAVGSGATTSYNDNLGNILNLVLIRDASTHDPILSADGRTVFGLVQCASGTADGTAVGANGAENTQLSFVYIAADGTLTLETVTATIEFQVNKLYKEGQQPDIMLVGGNQEPIIVEPVTMEPDVRKFIVTAAFAANEVLTLTTGAGAATGTSTASGDTVVLSTSAALFNADNRIRVRLNGLQLIRGTDVVWDSTNSFHISIIMDVSDVLEAEVSNE